MNHKPRLPTGLLAEARLFPPVCASRKYCAGFGYWLMTVGVALATLTGYAAFAADGETRRVSVAADIHAGEIREIVTTVEPVKWVSLERILESGNLTPEEPMDNEVTMRKPAAGKMFVIFHLKLDEGMSVGRYDYELKLSGESVKCSAIQRGEGAFDPRVWRLEYKDSATPVRMLYEVRVPEQEQKALLSLRLNTIIPLPGTPVKITPPASVAESD